MIVTESKDMLRREINMITIVKVDSQAIILLKKEGM